MYNPDILKFDWISKPKFERTRSLFTERAFGSQNKERVQKAFVSFFTRATLCYIARVFATATCPSVCPSVCHTPVLCLAERKQDREMYTV